MFELAFQSEMTKVAGTSTIQDILAGADGSLTLSHRSGLNNSRDHKRHIRDVAIGGAAVGGVTGLLTSAVGAGFMGSWHDTKGQPVRRRISLGIGGGVANLGKKMTALAKPWKRKNWGDAGIGLTMIGTGAGFQAAQVANQYRLGQRARNHTLQQLSERDRDQWWTENRPGHMRLPAVKQAALTRSQLVAVGESLKSSRRPLIAALAVSGAAGAGVSMAVPGDDGARGFHRERPVASLGIGTLLGLGVGLGVGAGMRNTAFRQGLIRRLGPASAEKTLQAVPRHLGYGIK